MPQLASGAAFVDRSGAVVAADAGFLARLALPADDPTRALQARAETSPPLRAFLAGDGPAIMRLDGPRGAVDVERVPSGEGMLLLLRPAQVDELLEHAMRSQGLGRIAGGVVHDIKNPLNAMSLQVAILGEKLSSSVEATGAAAGPLGAVRDQIGRVNEILRRFLDVTNPDAPLGYTDVGALLLDVVALFTHEARRRRVTVSVEGQPGSVRTCCEPGRVGRLVLGLFARALAETPEGGRLSARAEGRDGVAFVTIEHGAGDRDPALGYYTEVADASARALGGGFAEERRDGVARLSLALPRNDP